VPETRPNVVFFFTDDQRFDTIAALGNSQIHTPNLDRLAREGTTFTHAHIMGGSCPAVCMPSRAMLMTGRTLYHLENCGENIPDSHALMGETLRNAGYRTCGIGKWHNGTRGYHRSFTDGAEIYFGGMCDHWNVPANDFDPTGAYDKRLPVCVDPSSTNEVRYLAADHRPAGIHSTDLFSAAAIDFIDRQEKENPFFLYLSFMAPHDPRTMPQEFLDMYDPDTIDLPLNAMREHPFDNGELRIRDELLEDFPRLPHRIKKHIAEYYAMITHLDARIGAVIARLSEKGMLDNTIIVFAGDNGLALGQHGLMGKQNLYDHSVRVPLMFKGPGIPAGERRESFAYLLDIFPTLCELTGLDCPDTVDGKSLVPAFAHPDEQIRPTLYCAYKSWQRSVRDRQYKLIEYVVNGERRTQLFDLNNDRHELRNLAREPEMKDTVERLRKELKSWREMTDDFRPGQGADFWGGFDA
jgi:arylsulfatase A-like enzyme